MTKCSICNLEMNTAKGCIGEFIEWEGKEYRRYRHGEDYRSEGRRCHDCGAQVGGLHHASCDWEHCPVCQKGQQLLGCLHGNVLVHYGDK